MIKGMILFFTLMASLALYSSDDLAKVVKMRGRVIAYEKGQTPFRVRLGMTLSEQTAVETERSSFVRLKMIDGSLINLAPSSKMVINRLPDSSRPGILSLVKGTLRAKVQKEEGQDKLFIRTKTASMGVRGTDFQVLYNPENNVTNTVTYSGEVAMRQTKGLVSLPDLDRALNGSEMVSIRRGQFSFANPGLGSRVTLPTKLSPVQFHSMRRNQDFSQAKKVAAKMTRIKPIIPRGISSRGFIKESTVLKNVVAPKGPQVLSPPPEGFHDAKTGQMAPPAGGYVDIKTGVYVAPPPGSVFDSNTGVYVPPVEFGQVDPGSGGYIPPAGAILTDNGELKKGSEIIANVMPLKPLPNPIEGVPLSTNEPLAPPPPPIEESFTINPDDLIPDKPLPKGRVKFNFTTG